MLGVLLADGCLWCKRTPTKRQVTAAMHGGAGERDFLQEKANEIRNWIPTKAQLASYSTGLRDSGKTTTVLRFRFTSDKLLPIYNLLYPRGDREITSPVLEILGGRAAAWLWAEGARDAGAQGWSLRRVGQTDDEARLVAGWLQVLTGAACTVIHSRTGEQKKPGLPRLLFPPDQAERVRETLASYAPASRQHLFLGV